MDTPKHNKVELPVSAVRQPTPVPSAAPSVAPISSQNPKKQRATDRKFSLFVYAILLLSALVGGYVLFTGPLSTFTHAVVPLSASEAESSIYAYPLSIRADGSSESKIDIFVSSNSSLPLAGKKVDISSTMGSIVPASAMTDKLGHVSYTLTMSEPGIATISFMVNGQQFAKQVTVQGE